MTAESGETGRDPGRRAGRDRPFDPTPLRVRRRQGPGLRARDGEPRGEVVPSVLGDADAHVVGAHLDPKVTVTLVVLPERTIVRGTLSPGFIAEMAALNCVSVVTGLPPTAVMMSPPSR